MGRADPGTVISDLLSVPQLVALVAAVTRRVLGDGGISVVFSCGKAIDAPLFCGVTRYIWSL